MFFSFHSSPPGIMMASDAPVQSSMGCHLGVQGTQGMEGVQGTKTTGIFGKISIKNYLINLCVIPKK